MNTLNTSPNNADSLRLSDTVYERLLDDILSGRLLPGTPVSEVALSRQLEVSRTPVHDALRQLAKDGLVEQRANHRAIIARFSPSDVHDIFEMRKLLEAEAARRAASRIDRQTLAHLRSLAEVLQQKQLDSEWLMLWAEFDEKCHDAIARSSGSFRLRQDITRYRMLHRGFHKLGSRSDFLRQALAEHLAILDALESRDPDKAAQAMASHLQEWQAYFVNHHPR